MGLDVTIVKIRKKNIISDATIEELYKDGKYVSQYRNIWDILSILNLTPLENDNGECYRIINDIPIHKLNNCGLETEIFLDNDKFTYILKADW